MHVNSFLITFNPENQLNVSEMYELVFDIEIFFNYNDFCNFNANDLTKLLNDLTQCAFTRTNERLKNFLNCFYVFCVVRITNMVLLERALCIGLCMIAELFSKVLLTLSDVESANRLVLCAAGLVAGESLQNASTSFSSILASGWNCLSTDTFKSRLLSYIPKLTPFLRAVKRIPIDDAQHLYRVDVEPAFANYCLDTLERAYQALHITVRPCLDKGIQRLVSNKPHFQMKVRSKDTTQRNNQTLRILSCNINGWKSKSVEFEKLVSEKKPDVIALQETL